MNFLELTKKRLSVRAYKKQPVDDATLEYILESARMAPSACNKQPWSFLVVSSEEGHKAICQAYPRDWVSDAYMFIILCGDKYNAWERPGDKKNHLDIDAGIVMEHICLAAAEKEIGTCIICNFSTDICKLYFNIPNHIEPLAIIAIGYPNDPDVFSKTPKTRKELSEIIYKETF